MNVAQSYERVNEVQQVAPVTPLTLPEAGKAIRKMWRHLTGHACSMRVVETTGNRYSWGYGSEFRVNCQSGWDDLIHHFSHWYYWRYLKMPGDRPHSKAHARLELKLRKWAIKHGWTTGSLLKAETEPVEPTRDEARAKLIERRREQVARLERKIKSLTTRMKKAKRSLGALERAAAK